MSITDELREYIWQHATNNDELRAIADRIDAEHQKAEDEWKAKDGQTWLRGYAECRAELMEGNEVIAADLEKAGWVKFPPLDADGEPWHIGDEIANQYNLHLTVSEIVYASNGYWMLHAKPNWRFYANIACHYHAPTVEGVLREFAEKITDSQIPNVHPTYEEAIAEYAKRLRLAGDAE